MNLTKDEYADFARKFLEEYVDKRGFGAMNKTDVEILVYNLLEKTSFLKPKSVYERSVALRVNMSRIKRLDHDAALRYGELDEKELLSQVVAHISKAQFSSDGKRIQFAMPDALLRDFFTAKLTSLNAFADTSFNHDIVSVDITFFAMFLDQFVYTDESSKRDLEQRIMEVLKKHGVKMDDTTASKGKYSKLTLLLSKLLEAFATSAIKVAAQKTVGMFFEKLVSVSALTDLLNNLF